MRGCSARHWHTAGSASVWWLASSTTFSPAASCCSILSNLSLCPRTCAALCLPSPLAEYDQRPHAMLLVHLFSWVKGEVSKLRLPSL